MTKYRIRFVRDGVHYVQKKDGLSAWRDMGSWKFGMYPFEDYLKPHEFATVDAAKAYIDHCIDLTKKKEELKRKQEEYIYYP